MHITEFEFLLYCLSGWACSDDLVFVFVHKNIVSPCSVLLLDRSCCWAALFMKSFFVLSPLIGGFGS